MNVMKGIGDIGIGSAIFFPRPDMPFEPPAQGAWDRMFEAPGDVTLRLRIFPGPTDAPAVLFFHGNGETGRDYDGVADLYRDLPATLAVAEYRGYGPCTGRPSIETFVEDAHVALDELKKLLAEQSRSQKIFAMGRSLGSAPAIELASSRKDDLCGLVVESGFARILPLYHLLGVPAAALGLTEQEHGPRNLEKIGRVSIPTLIMHAEQDEIIPFQEAEMLYEAAADPDKIMVSVPSAGHNDILMRAGSRYFDAIRDLVARSS